MESEERIVTAATLMESWSEEPEEYESKFEHEHVRVVPTRDSTVQELVSHCTPSQMPHVVWLVAPHT